MKKLGKHYGPVQAVASGLVPAQSSLDCFFFPGDFVSLFFLPKALSQ